MIKDIELIITGGTIDSGIDYDPDKDAIFQENVKSNIKLYIEKFLQPEIKIYENTICLLDSKDITEQIREKVCNSIIASKTDNIIVTHGSDTMVQTADYLASRIKNKKVILVGSFIPLVFHQSDAPFNLGFAFGVIEHIENGVYIAMNSQLFKAGTVKKDFTNKKFVLK